MRAKRLCALCVLIIFLAVSPLTAYADVVFNNDFFRKNSDKTERVSTYYDIETFIINSPEGYVIPQVEPGTEHKVVPTSKYYKFTDLFDSESRWSRFLAEYRNGEYIYIEAVYLHEGEYWGVMTASHSYFPGWVRMDDLLMPYSGEDFYNDNRDSFYTYTGNYDAILSANTVVGWHWPGSDRENRIYDSRKTIAAFADVDCAYMDEDGREWGRTSYRGIWICLSDPENADLPAFSPAPTPIKWSPDYERDWSSAGTVWTPEAVMAAQSISATVASFNIMTPIIIAASALVLGSVAVLLNRKVIQKRRGK